MENKSLKQVQNQELHKIDISISSCIGCKYCIALANKQMKISFACTQRVWIEILPNISDLVGKTCDMYVKK